MHKRTSFSDSKGVTDQRHLAEKLYGIAFERNVHQLKVALALGTAYFTIALSLTVNTSASNSVYISL